MPARSARRTWDRAVPLLSQGGSRRRHPHARASSGERFAQAAGVGIQRPQSVLGGSATLGAVARSWKDAGRFACQVEQQGVVASAQLHGGGAVDDRAGSATAECSAGPTSIYEQMTEGEGFEPSSEEDPENGFQGRRVQPLRHPSWATSSRLIDQCRPRDAAELSGRRLAMVRADLRQVAKEARCNIFRARRPLRVRRWAYGASSAA